MKQHYDYEDLEAGLETDDLPPAMSAQIEHLSRRWAEEEDRQARQQRRGLTRRRIEDWREERALRREFEDDLDLN
ncbi:MAG: hypothetical protein U5Q16_05745 [Gammaproteobacteria bacterium]|nr:hypothetical protein [Gammaproteobacteria bacterium]